jgi:hypothetical protein
MTSMVWPGGRLSWNGYRGRSGDPAAEVTGAAYPYGRGTTRSDSEARVHVKRIVCEIPEHK